MAIREILTKKDRRKIQQERANEILRKEGLLPSRKSYINQAHKEKLKSGLFKVGRGASAFGRGTYKVAKRGYEGYKRTKEASRRGYEAGRKNYIIFQGAVQKTGLAAQRVEHERHKFGREFRRNTGFRENNMGNSFNLEFPSLGVNEMHIRRKKKRGLSMEIDTGGLV